MNIKHQNQHIYETDYYSSADYARGQAWLLVRDSRWHVLLPGLPRGKNEIQAGPEENPDEPGGWEWCLDLDGERYPLPSRCIMGVRPRLPDKGQAWQRSCVLYTGFTANASRAAFGGVHDLRSGLQSTSHTLWLVHGCRVGYKPRVRA